METEIAYSIDAEGNLVVSVTTNSTHMCFSIAPENVSEYARGTEIAALEFKARA